MIKKPQLILLKSGKDKGWGVRYYREAGKKQ